MASSFALEAILSKIMRHENRLAGQWLRRHGSFLDLNGQELVIRVDYRGGEFMNRACRRRRLHLGQLQPQRTNLRPVPPVRRTLTKNKNPGHAALLVTLTATIHGISLPHTIE